MRHGHGNVSIDTFVQINQRKAECPKCGSVYQGPKEHVTCKGCGFEMDTKDVGCTQKVPVGVWNLAGERKQKNDG